MDNNDIITQNKDKINEFQKELRKFFRTEDSDLKFGIYRITNQFNKDIDKYIENISNLVFKKVTELQDKSNQHKISSLEKEIKELEDYSKKLGEDVTKKEKYIQLNKELKENVNVENHIDSIFTHLINFFNRFYQDGDFINQFKYSDEEYLIPYSGEEVLLHWATKDMYFVKTSDIYKKLSFQLDLLKNNKIDIECRLLSSDIQKNNTKSTGKYYFCLNEEVPFEFKEQKQDNKSNYLLILNFSKVKKDNLDIKYKDIKENEIQNNINDDIIKIINDALLDKSLYLNVDENRQNIIKNLDKFQRRSKEDFFIHKNLGLFLRKQLDFYINQNILNISTIYNSEEIDVKKEKLLESKVFYDLAIDIITKLDEIEKFKKRMWEKKKFVLDTNYVFKMSFIKKKINSNLYSKYLLCLKENLVNNYIDYYNVLSNNLKQPLKNIFLESYKVNGNEINLFYYKRFQQKIDSNDINLVRLELIKKIEKEGLDSTNFIEKIELKSNQSFLCLYVKLNLEKNLIDCNTSLVKNKNIKLISKINLNDLYLDTKNISEDLKYELLNHIDKIDDELNGIVINSNNFCALNLLNFKYNSKIQLIYIDPPFNTGKDFIYKDKFKDSSWISFIYNLLNFNYLKANGSLYVHLDENANYLLRSILNSSKYLFKREIIWNTGKITGYKDKFVPWFRQHDSIFLYSYNDSYKFYKLYNLKESIRQSVSNHGWLDLLYIDNKYGYFIWNNVDFNFVEIKYSEEDIISLGDVWNDIYNRTYTQVQTTEILDYDTQKPENLLRRIIQSSTDIKDWVLDFFSGSGTTSAVAHKLNRKYISIDFGIESINTTIFRLKGVLLGFDCTHLSKDINWQGGGFFKYQTLEQFEDTLENIEFDQKDLRDYDNLDIRLKYFLTEDIKNKNIFLGVNTEKEFLNLSIRVLKEDGSTELKKVDLIETFNYLIGMWVDKIKVLENINDNNRKYYFISGISNNQKTFIVWRDPNGIDNDISYKLDSDFIHLEMDNDTYNLKYINSDCSIKGFYNIYDEFRKRLFEDVVL